MRLEQIIKKRFDEEGILKIDLTPNVRPVNANMYVVSNISEKYGSALILDSQICSVLRDKIGAGFFVLPTSLNEVIAVKNGAIPIRAMQQAVKENNSDPACMNPCIFLSDRVFQDTDNGLISVSA